MDTDQAAPNCSFCDCCSKRKYPSSRNWYPCSRCANARSFHGFSGHVELDKYMAKGCWVCGEPAKYIDHDHSMACHPVGQKVNGHHPTVGSCELCRRGPICASHNVILEAGKSSDDLVTWASELQRRADQVMQAAKALATWEGSRS